MSDSDYVVEERGDYRVLLKPEEYAEEPYFEGGPPILRIDRRWSRDTGHVMYYGRPTIDDSRIEEAARRWVYDLDLLEKYLRAYYGTTVFKQYGPNQATDYTYVTYDTARWREYIGYPPGSQLPRAYAESVNMDEYQAYLEGDVYYYQVQKRVYWTTDDPGYDDEDRWEDTPDGTVGGFYGHKWAEEAAREALNDAYEISIADYPEGTEERSSNDE